jgi:WD40 repeat protein
MARLGKEERFIAFISYKHQTSKSFAERLETALMTYAKPLLSRPPAVFRDENYVVPTGDLPAFIESALKRSDHLILLASPEAAASPWVQSELTTFCETLNRRDKLIIVLTSGDIGVDVVARKVLWDPAKTTALPAMLARSLPSIPFWIDLRGLTTPEQLSLSHPHFRSEVNRLVAHLRGVTPAEMIGEELKVWRRNRMLARATVVTLAIAAVSLALLALGLSRSNRELAEQRAQAVRNAERSERLRAISDVELTAARARLAAREEPHVALELAAAAWEGRPRDSADAGTVDPAVAPVAERARFELAATAAAVLGEHLGLRGHLRAHATGINGLHLGRDGTLLSSARDSYVVLWDLDRQAPLRRLHHPRGHALTSAVHRDAGLIIAASAEDVVVWRGAEAPRVLDVKGVSVLALQPDGGQAVAGTGDGATHLIDTHSLEVAPLGKRDGLIAGLAFSPDGKWLYVGAYEQENEVHIWDVKARTRLRATLRGHVLAATDIVPSTDGTRIAAASEGDRAVVWESNGKLAGSWSPGGTVTGVAFDERHVDQLFSIQGDGTLLTWRLGEASPVDTRYAHRGGAYAIVADGARDLVLTGGADGAIRLWSSSPSHPLMKRLPRSEGHGSRATWNGSRIAAVGRASLRVWALPGRVVEEHPLDLPQTAELLLGVGGPEPVIVAGPGFESQNQDLFVWSPRSRGVVSTLPVSRRGVTEVAISPSGESAAAAIPGRSGGLFLWTLGTERPEPSLLEPWPGADALAFDVGGGLLVSVSSAGADAKKLTLWDVATRKPREQAVLPGVSAVTSVAVAPAGDRVALGLLRGDVRIHDQRDWPSAAHRFTRFSSSIQGLAFDPAGTWLAACDESTVMVASAGTGQIVATVPAGGDCIGLEFDSTGKHLLVSTRKGLAVMTVDPEAWARLARELAGTPRAATSSTGGGLE